MNDCKRKYWDAEFWSLFYDRKKLKCLVSTWIISLLWTIIVSKLSRQCYIALKVLSFWQFRTDCECLKGLVRRHLLRLETLLHQYKERKDHLSLMGKIWIYFLLCKDSEYKRLFNRRPNGNSVLFGKVVGFLSLYCCCIVLITVTN